MWRGRHAAPIFYMEDNQVNWNNPNVSVGTLPISNPNLAAAHEAGNFHEHMAYNTTAVDGEGGGFLGWLDGTNKQRQAQAFEMTMQERQWAYDDPSAQMERMKKAGINPNLAAGAIAGGNQSAGAPSSPVSAGNGAEAIGHIASAVGAVGGAANAAVGAIDTLSTLEGRKKLLFTQNTKMFEEMGFTKLQAQGYSIQLQFMDDKEKLGIAKMCCDIGEASQRVSESKARVKQIDQNISESKEHEKLYRKQGNLADAEREKVQQEGYLLEKKNYQEQFRNDFIRDYSVDPYQPLVNQIAMAHVAGKNDTVEKLTGAVYNYNYNFYQGQYEAQTDWGPVLNKFHAVQVANKKIQKLFEDRKTNKDAYAHIVEDLQGTFKEFTESNKDNPKRFLEDRAFWIQTYEMLSEQIANGDDSPELKDALKEAETMVNAPYSVYKEKYNY